MQIQLSRPIVPIEQWLTDPFYLGPHAGKQWKFWEDEYIKFFNDPVAYITLIVTGSNRGGKTHNVIFFMLRYIYEISCIRNFPELFGLSSATKLLFVFLSLRKEKAKDAGIGKMLRILEGIPYFEHVFPYDRGIQSKIVFPGIEIRPGSSTDDLVSEDLFGVIFDEANFVRAKAGAEFAKAKEIFLEARTRGQLTFSIGGRHYGFFALISSASTQTSFVEHQIREAKSKGNGYVIIAPVYKTHPEAYSQEKFRVFCGIDDVEPHIIDDVPFEIPQFVNKTYGMTYEDFLSQHSDQVELVPVDFLPRFQEDIVFGIRFLCGRPINTASAFLKNKGAFDAIFRKELKSPLLVTIPTLSLLDDDTIQDFVDEDALLELIEDGANCYIHYDLGLRGDKDGDGGDFAGFGLAFKTEKGRIRIALYFRVARKNSADEIDTSKLEDIVYWLIELGVVVKLVTKDLLARGYFSQNLIKRLGKERVANLSLDRTDIPFLVFSSLMKKGLLEAYSYTPFREEYPNLIHDNASHKVIKPEGGNDDISQAVIGAVYDCFQGEGMTFESLAMQEAMAAQGPPPTDTDDFYSGALLEGMNDDFYTSILNGADDEAEDFVRGIQGDEDDVTRIALDYEDEIAFPDRAHNRKTRDPKLRDSVRNPLRTPR
jgi:hypothetical protein